MRWRCQATQATARRLWGVLRRIGIELRFKKFALAAVGRIDCRGTGGEAERPVGIHCVRDGAGWDCAGDCEGSKNRCDQQYSRSYVDSKGQYK